jgi:Ca-activated chloride channel homolog
MRRISLLLAVVFLAVFSHESVQSFDLPSETSGQLEVFTKKGDALGLSPLRHTDVRADISGFLARVTVRQEFENNFAQPIEAVYTFPLSENSAVDDMLMKIGERTIRGRIKKREEAREIYEQAKTEGKTAALLDQERPNVFTQSVANILPGEKIVIEISYVETLKYEDGAYEFVFPMTVGPRYTPASTEAEDAAKVNPPVAPKMRAGHDIAVEVNLNAGVPVENISSTLHEINTQNLSPNSAQIGLKNEREIPNKDFILKYDVTGKRIADAVLTHRDVRGGFFTMMLAPPEDFRVADVAPKEIVFVLDTSGSMGGFPIEKAKEAMKLSLEGLYPDDTFNLITFAGDTHILFDAPVPATQANLETALEFLETRRGGGGTEMMKAIEAALKPSAANEHLRIVNFMTDGYVSNEAEIIGAIRKHKNARVFSFGIGDSVNRFLLSKMAEEGRGEATFVTLEDDGSKAARKFHERIRNPLLTDIELEWNGLPVADVYPKRNPDLFDAEPVVINGRYTKAASGSVKLKGKIGGQVYEREIKVEFPATEPRHNVLATLWARKRIDDLMSRNFDYEMEETRLSSKETQLITNLGLEFRLLTEFTSFVAVEEVVRTQRGKPVTVEVPVELANGTFGEDSLLGMSDSGGGGGGGGISNGSGSGKGTGVGSGFGNGIALPAAPPPPAPAPPAPQLPPVSNTSGAVPKRISAGVVNGKSVNLPAPAYPAAASAANIKGSVAIQVTIDESGNVISATPVSGHPLLRASAVTAARSSQFAPTLLSGQPVQVSGVIVYNFDNGSATPAVPQNLPPNPLATVTATEATPEPEEKSDLKRKLHFWLYDLVERLQKGGAQAGPFEAMYVKNERAQVRIYLTPNAAGVSERLKDLGFEAAGESGKDFVSGEIAVEKLAELVEIDGIEYILPKIR